MTARPTVSALLRAIGILVTLVLTAWVLAACGSGNASSPPSGGTQATPAASATPGEPDTAAGAQAAAQTVFELYGGGQYSAVYADMAPSFTSEVAESTYVTVHQDCPGNSQSYQVTDPVLSGSSSAVVTVSLAGAASSIASETEAFDYVSGKWLWAPSAALVAPYEAGSVSAIVSLMKAQGECQ